MAAEKVCEGEPEEISVSEDTRHNDKPARKSAKSPILTPTWKSNILIFGLLILIVLAYYYKQINITRETFINQAQQHAKMVSQIIELNVRNAVLSQKIIEEIMSTFLGNTARFVEYLDAVEPFKTEELTEFALESGLAGIAVIHNGNQMVLGPPNWIDPKSFVCLKTPSPLFHSTSQHIYYLTWPGSIEPKCIAVGITAANIEKLRNQVALPRLLRRLSNFMGIRYVRIIESTRPPRIDPADAEVKLIDSGLHKIAETRLPFGKDLLIVGISAENFFARINSLFEEFLLFSMLLAILGGFFSWLLHRNQTAYIKKIQDYERELAKQREDAALGRAAAAITHEIRNPLNAISMGLQRFRIESGNLSEDEYRNLTDTMLQAVQRTNRIVSNIQRYAKPLKPKKHPIRIDRKIENLLTLYREKAKNSQIDIHLDVECHSEIEADGDLIEQTIENLIKNAFEAQTEGGFLHISITQKDQYLILSFENGGFDLSETEAQKIFEPYFTTKTQGTGLGLAIAQKIVLSHNGRMEINSPEKGIIQMNIFLPISPEQK